jgi:antitoxin ChpS
MSTRPKYTLAELLAQSGYEVEPVTAPHGPSRTRPKYTIEQLLADCDPNAELTEEDREWLSDPPVGREVI